VKGENKLRIIGAVAYCCLMAGCTLAFKDNDPDIEISYSFNNFDQAWQYVSSLEYKHDIDVHGKRDYWQSPLETYTLGSGDCEDFTILLMHLANRLGYNSYLIITKENGQAHAIIRIDGIYYEPQVYNFLIPKENIDYIYLVRSYKAVTNMFGTQNLYMTGGRQ
jgi:hypothetical protein